MNESPDITEKLALMERRYRRAEVARAEAEALLDQHARALDHANRELKLRERDLLVRLESGNRHLLLAQRTAAIATIHRDRGGAFFASPELGHILGLASDEPVDGRTVAKSVHPLDRERVRKAEAGFYRDVPAGSDHRYEHRVVRRDGCVRWVRWVLRREVDAEGHLLSVFGTVQDITEQRANERRVRALQYISERRVRQLSRLTLDLRRATLLQEQNATFLAAVLDTVPQGVAVFDSDMRLAAWNSHLGDLAGLRADQLHTGMEFASFTDLHWHNDPAMRGDRLERDARGRILAQTYERSLPDGRVVLIAVTLSADGGVVQTYTDVSRFKEIERDLRTQGEHLADRVEELERLSRALRHSNAEAEQANRSKSQFLAMMSHDIRTPMNGVLGMLELLSDTPLTEQQSTWLSLARQSGEQLQILLSDIIEIVRAEAGKLDLAPVPLDIRRMVEAAAEFWRSGEISPDVQLEWHVAENLPAQVVLDPTRLRQLLDNLVGNAIKYTRIGYVQILADRRAECLRIAVKDSGPGIDPAMQAVLFNDFSKLITMATAHAPGAGLGLAICKRLVDAMGGTIGVKSDTTSGSCFWFELPLVAADAEAATTALARSAKIVTNKGARPRLLIAEDIETNRLVLSAILDTLGCDSVAVEDGAAAVDAVTKGDFDLVLMDVQMPGIDGEEATRMIRALDGPVASVPIIGITAHALHAERLPLLDAGMTMCLSKPIDRGLLASALTEILAAPAMLPSPAPVTPAPPIPGLLDEAILTTLMSALPPARRRTMLAMAADDLTRLGGALMAAVGKDAAEEARRAAHSLSGVASNIGATGLMNHLQQWRDGAPADQAWCDTLERLTAATLVLSRDLTDRLEAAESQ